MLWCHLAFHTSICVALAAVVVAHETRSKRERCSGRLWPLGVDFFLDDCLLSTSIRRLPLVHPLDLYSYGKFDGSQGLHSPRPPLRCTCTGTWHVLTDLGVKRGRSILHITYQSYIYYELVIVIDGTLIPLAMIMYPNGR